MALLSAEKKENNKAQIKFTIDAAKFNDEVTKVFKKKASTITVPGFRRGKAPRQIVEKMYGKGIFFEDALNNLIPEAYDEALKASGLETVSRPEIDAEKIDEDGVVLVADVTTKPEVTVTGYTGIEVTREVEDATNEEVNSEIEKVRTRNARTIEVTDRAAQNGDTVKIDFEGSVDGVPFEGGKGEGYDLKLGSGQFIPGFEDQIVGHSIGDSFDVNVTFPADYQAKELSGKAAVFKTKLNSIKFEELPALDDEFAKDVSEFDTLDEYKADIKAKIQDRKEKDADSAVEGQLIDALIGKLEADIPNEMYTAETENFVRDYDTRLRMQGMDLSSYFKYTGTSLDALREQLRPQAERQVKTRLALEKIASLENITANDEEAEEEINKLSESYKMSIEEVKKLVDVSDIKKDLAVKKAVDFVKDHAVITVNKKGNSEPEKKTEKKAKAKAEESK